MRGMMRLALLGVPGAQVSDGYQTITAPEGWTYELPFAVQTDGTNFRAWDTSTGAEFDLTTLAPTGKAYYVATDGDDNLNDGLSPESPLRRIHTALKKPDSEVIYVAAGVYDYGMGVTGEEPDRDTSIIATGGRVTLGAMAATDTLSWALDTAGGNDNTWKAARTNVGRAYDNAHQDAHGDAALLTKQASAAAVEAAPGSWYTDGTSVWVRTVDDRQPDLDIFLCYTNVPYAAEVLADTTVYWEGFDFVGGNTYCMFVRNAAGTDDTRAYFKDCTFKYAVESGVRVDGATAIFQNCVSAANGDDGISYKTLNTITSAGVEINVVGRDNGATGDIDNGSTCHDGGLTFRLNCEYMRNVGPNVQDIHSGTKSWNINCYAHDSASVANSRNWVAGGDATSTIMWLDSCRADNSDIDLYAFASAALYVRNCTYTTDDGGGTIEAY